MKHKVIWLFLSFLLVAATLLASCATSKTSTYMSTSTTTKTTTTTTKTTAVTQTTTTASTVTTTAATTSALGNWWNSLGTPKFGGTITVRLPADIGGFDLYYLGGLSSILCAWEEPLWSFDWTVDPSVFAFKTTYTPFEDTAGQLAQTYEMPDPSTVIFHLKQEIHWQNIPPANGRLLTADDVAAHFNRQWGLAGYKGSAFSSPAVMKKLTSVIADDTANTVTFKFNGASTEATLEAILGQGKMIIECPDVVAQYGNTNDWHHALGTGPYMLTDYVSGSSATLDKNPNYWGHDERYPQNKLPYADALKYLVIADTPTALAAMRTGKIDILDGLASQDANAMKKSNPEISQVTYPPLIGISLDPRNDVAPFNDIRVREAMQLAINLPEIAQNYYAGTVPPTPETLTSSYLTGWGYPYSQWPQDLKDQYAYNPTQAKALLAAAGFSNGFHTDVVAMNIGDLNLLQVIQSYLAAVNINMSITTMDQTSWINYVQVGHKQDALAYKNQGFLAFTGNPGDSVVQYYSQNATAWGMVNDPNYDALVAKATAATSSLADVKQALQDMNKLVAQQHYSISLPESVYYAFYQPWLKGYSGQIGGVSGVFTAGPSIYFYMARFWIDKNLKESLGH